MELRPGTILLATWWAMIPTDIVRWHGPERVRTFEGVDGGQKQSDPDVLVSASYPSTSI